MSLKEDALSTLLNSPVLATGVSVVGNIIVAIAAGFFVSSIESQNESLKCFYKFGSFWVLMAVLGFRCWFNYQYNSTTYKIIDEESARVFMTKELVPEMKEYLKKEIRKGNLEPIDEVMDKIESVSPS